MRGSSDWLPIFWLFVGILALAKAIRVLRARRQQSLQRKADCEALEEPRWIRHWHSEN